jgi:dTDP-4-amino-4,6-dideoxygalactose transaminase
MKPIQLTRPILPPLAELAEELREPWESGRLSNFGPKHEELERVLRDRLGVQYLSLFNNGTTALIAAIQALRLSGEVIVTPFTFPATIHALAWNGIMPVFCDVKYDDMTIDPEEIRKLITAKTSAILGVHVFGNVCDVMEIQKIADEYGLKVIYDAAHAFDVKYDGAGVGRYGDISMFSFHPTKLFHTGEGGALTFNDVNFKSRLYYSKNFGIKSETEVVSTGINGKMSEIQAALGLVVLRHLDAEISKRETRRTLYQELLKDHPYFKIMSANNEQYLIIRAPLYRERFYSHLRENNIFARRYFYPLCSSFSCYRNSPSGILFNAENIADEVLALPFYGDLSDQEVKRICDILTEPF